MWTVDKSVAQIRSGGNATNAISVNLVMETQFKFERKFNRIFSGETCPNNLIDFSVPEAERVFVSYM